MQNILNFLGVTFILVGTPLILFGILMRFILWKNNSNSYKKIKPILMRILFGKYWREA